MTENGSHLLSDSLCPYMHHLLTNEASAQTPEVMYRGRIIATGSEASTGLLRELHGCQKLQRALIVTCFK